MDPHLATLDLVSAAAQTRFVTLVRSPADVVRTRLLVKSLRAFGGPMRDCPFWVFIPKVVDLSCDFPDLGEVECVSLDMEEKFLRYILGDKVFVCAQAEEMAGPDVRTLIWISTDALIVQPPVHFLLSGPLESAFRAVHVQNIGSLASEPLDGYWSEIYRRLGMKDTSLTVESFVDEQRIRPYYNSHLFSVDPAQGLMQAWRDHFKAFVDDDEFQTAHCADVTHQIFLHQAVLSALLTRGFNPERMRVLPPEYSYPLHFQGDIPEPKVARTLNELVVPVYEQLCPRPDKLDDPKVEEPLASWLLEHVPVWGEE